MSNFDLLFKMGADVTQFEGSMSKVMTSVKGFIGSFIGVAAVTSTLKAIMTETLEEEKASYALASAMKTLKGATEAQYNALIDLSEQMSLASGKDAAELKAALTKLVYVTGDAEVAQKSLNAAMELSAATGMNVEAAARLVGRAYLGNTTMLKKMGIELGNVKGGMEAVHAIETKFSGAWESHAQSTAGHLERFGAAWRQLGETMGENVLPNWNKLIDLFTPTEQFMNDMKTVLNELLPKADLLAIKLQVAGAEKELKTLRDEFAAMNKDLNSYDFTGDRSALGKSLTAYNKKISDAELALGKLRDKQNFIAGGGSSEAWNKSVGGVNPEAGNDTSKIPALPADAGGEDEFIAKDAEDAKAAIDLFEKMQAAGQTAADAVATSMESMFSKIYKGSASAKDVMKEMFLGIGKTALDMIEKQITAQIALDFAMLNPMAAAAGFAQLAIVEALKAGLSATAMAEGGIVDKPTFALIGEAGPEAVVPLSGGKGAGLGGNTTVNFINNGMVGEAEQVLRDKFLPAMKKHFATNRGGQIGTTKSGEAVNLNL